MWNEEQSQTIDPIYTRGGCRLQGNLTANADGIFPRWSEGTGTLRPLVGSKGAVGQGMFTMASFANTTVPTLTQRPETGTIVPRSTMQIRKLNKGHWLFWPPVSPELVCNWGQLQTLLRPNTFSATNTFSLHCYDLTLLTRTPKCA